MSDVESNQQTKIVEVETGDYEIPSPVNSELNVSSDASDESDTQQYLESIGKTIWVWTISHWIQATIIHYIEDGAVALVRYAEEQQCRLYETYRLIDAEFVISEDKPTYVPEHEDEDDEDEESEDEESEEDEDENYAGSFAFKITVDNINYLFEPNTHEVFSFDKINGFNSYLGMYNETDNKILFDDNSDDDSDDDYTQTDGNFDGDGYQRGVYFESGSAIINLSPEDLESSRSFTISTDERKGRSTFTWR
jgi:hypothetical protein